MIALVTAIALWCSAPTAHRLQKYQVNSCRERLFKCIDEKRNAATMLRTTSLFEEKLRTCFETEKL